MLPPAPHLPQELGDVPTPLRDSKARRNNVHDFVFLNEIERRVIDTPAFQRLRYIKQLGFAHFVYETAEHSRFVHSVGVCHCAKVLVDAINRNLYLTKYADPVQHCQVYIPWGIRIIIGLAALLHDISHVPFSHAIEQECRAVPPHDQPSKNSYLWELLYSPKSEIRKILEEYSQPVLNLLKNAPQRGDIGATTSNLHLYSLPDLVFQVLNFPNDQCLHRGKCEYTVPSTNGIEIRIKKYCDIIQPYMHEIIGNTICADLIDYLLRDLSNTGLNRDIEFKFIDRISLRRFHSGWNNWHVAFDLLDRNNRLRTDARADLLFLLQTRYTMCEKVYMHRTKLAASVMLANAFMLSKGGEGMHPVIQRSDSSISYSDLKLGGSASSDDSILRYLQRSPNSSPLASRLLNRDLYVPFFLLDENSGSSSCPDWPKEKMRLIHRFRPSHDSGWEEIFKIQQQLEEPLEGTGLGDGVLILCLQENTAYKDPIVLVITDRDKSEPGNDRIEDLRSLRSSQGILDHIRSMVCDHNALWGLYLFIKKEYLFPLNGNLGGTRSRLRKVEETWRSILGYQYSNAIDWGSIMEAWHRKSCERKKICGSPPSIARDLSYWETNFPVLADDLFELIQNGNITESSVAQFTDRIQKGRQHISSLLTLDPKTRMAKLLRRIKKPAKATPRQKRI